MSAADTCLRAARLLRERAEAATPGPWCFYNRDLWRGTRAVLEAYDADCENMPWPFDSDDAGEPATWPDNSGTLFHGDPIREADAAFIAALHPDFALALAGWFETAAHVWASIEAQNARAPDNDGMTRVVPRPDECAALTAARVYLGDTS